MTEEEIKELKYNTIWWKNRYLSLSKRHKELQQENEKLKEEIIALNMKYGDGILLQERIDKAIEYIDENRYSNDEFDMIDIFNYEDFDVVQVKELLEILKGEENE